MFIGSQRTGLRKQLFCSHLPVWWSRGVPRCGTYGIGFQSLRARPVVAPNFSLSVVQIWRSTESSCPSLFKLRRVFIPVQLFNVITRSLYTPQNKGSSGRCCAPGLPSHGRVWWRSCTTTVRRWLFSRWIDCVLAVGGKSPFRALNAMHGRGCFRTKTVTSFIAWELLEM